MKLSGMLVQLILILSTASCFADNTIQLSLSESIKLALANNLDLKAEFYNPAQFEADVNHYRAIYEPILALQTSYSESRTNSMTTVAPVLDNNQFVLNSSLTTLFWTGGTATASFNNSYTANGLGTLPNYWQTGFGINLTQPLLQNAGRESTELLINVARLSKFSSLEHLKVRILNTIAQVRTDYYKLYSLREQLEVKKKSLELAQRILTETKARVNAGVLPAMEILNAEFGASTREKELNDAEQALQDQIDVVRLLLQLPLAVSNIVLTDAPHKDSMSINEDRAIKMAINRPDIRELKKNLELLELQSRVFNNKLKPNLVISTSAYLNGVDRTYLHDINKVVSADNPAWNIGLNFTYPLGNNAAESDYRKSRLKIEQQAVLIKSLEESALNDTRTALRGINSAYKQIEVTGRGQAFAEERFRSFVRKNEVGLATTKDVLDVENDLVAAKNNQINALVTYTNSLTRLWQATGELLEREKVQVVEGDVDKLYSTVR